MIKKSELFDNKQYTCDLWKWVSECKKDNSFVIIFDNNYFI